MGSGCLAVRVVREKKDTVEQASYINAIAMAAKQAMSPRIPISIEMDASISFFAFLGAGAAGAAAATWSVWVSSLTRGRDRESTPGCKVLI
jgi:hypothetical protein